MTKATNRRIQARISFGVSESLEFYDSDAKNTLKPNGLLQWTDWGHEFCTTMIFALRKIVLKDNY